MLGDYLMNLTPVSYFFLRSPIDVGRGRSSPGASSPARGGKGLGRGDAGRGRGSSPPSHGSPRTSRPGYDDFVVDLDSKFEAYETLRGGELPLHETSKNEMHAALSRVPRQLHEAGKCRCVSPLNLMLMIDTGFNL